MEISYSAENLKKARMLANLSVRKAASMAGVAPSAWSGYEANSKSPGVDALEKIAKGLGIKFLIG